MRVTYYIHCILDVMYSKSPYSVLQRAVHTHPTVADVIPTTLRDDAAAQGGPGPRGQPAGISDCSATRDVINAVIEKLARPYHTPGISR